MLRALTGAVYVAVILICVFAGFEWFWALTTLFAVLAILELGKLLSKKASINLVARVWDIAVAILLVASVRIINTGVLSDSRMMEWLIPFVGLTIVVMYLPVRIIIAICDCSERPLQSALFSILSITYVALPLAMLTMVFAITGKTIVLATFIFIWLNDTGAYLSGITLGRHKLCERLSPKKTWEGFWGGFIFCLIAGFLTPLFLDAKETYIYIMWILYAAAVSIMSTFGDLFESMIKRTLNVKDSGNLIPGHGGILDRIDSLLAVAPITLVFAFFINIFSI